MTVRARTETPNRTAYDVVIIGGAVLGSATAWFLADNPDFNGSVLVVERDPTYEFAATSHTNSCIRQQFSSDLNVRISQFGAEFVQNLPRYMGADSGALHAQIHPRQSGVRRPEHAQRRRPDRNELCLCRLIFSTTTIESSTSNPSASTNPAMVS